jgi:predicted CXXCH cytochrome family protein
MAAVNKRHVLIFSTISVVIIFVSVLWLPRFADSVTPADICPKHNVSSGEYTSCFYCHNAEAREEPGFTIRTDSGFCLSCHDGSTLDVSAYTSLGSVSERISKPVAIGHIKGVDHPFSVSYTEARNLSPTLKLKPLPKSPVKLFNDKIECASCHDPHSCSQPLFLRLSNNRSGLCLACHDM